MDQSNGYAQLFIIQKKRRYFTPLARGLVEKKTNTEHSHQKLFSTTILFLPVWPLAWPIVHLPTSHLLFHCLPHILSYNMLPFVSATRYTWKYPIQDFPKNDKKLICNNLTNLIVLVKKETKNTWVRRATNWLGTISIFQKFDSLTV